MHSFGLACWDNKGRIPRGWKEKGWIYFLGTEFRADKINYPYFLCLHWDEDTGWMDELLMPDEDEDNAGYNHEFVAVLID